MRLLRLPPLEVEKISAGSSNVVPKGSFRESKGSNSMRTMIFFRLRASSRFAAASASASNSSSSLSEPPPGWEPPSCWDFFSSSSSWSSSSSSSSTTSCSSSIWLTEEAADMLSPSPWLPARSSWECCVCNRFLTVTVWPDTSGRQRSKAFCSAASSSSSSLRPPKRFPIWAPEVIGTLRMTNSSTVTCTNPGLSYIAWNLCKLLFSTNQWIENWHVLGNKQLDHKNDSCDGWGVFVSAQQDHRPTKVQTWKSTAESKLRKHWFEPKESES